MKCNSRLSPEAALRLSVAALAIGMLLALGACRSRPPPMTFQTPEDAIDRLVAAVRGDNLPEVAQILGSGGEDLIWSGDEVADRQGRRRFLELYDEKHRVEWSSPHLATLCVGSIDWPLPIPIVRDGGSWAFDVEAGREEILNRRVGRNELDAVQVCLACVDAQRDYAVKDWDGDGVLEYAQRIESSPDSRDGLYWISGEGEEKSPLGELVAKAAAEGYVTASGGEEPQPYHGYLYRILKGQGEHAPDGAYDYMAGDSMMGGCAVVAFPAAYANSGVMTFIVSHAGVVYRKDLGEETGRIAMEMELFDPDPSWTKVTTP